METDQRPVRPGPETARLFFALWPDPGVRSGLHRAAVEAARHFGGRSTRADSLHLTLAFLGDCPLADLPKLEDAASRVDCEPFRLTLDQLGFWKHNRILWAGSREPVPGLSRLAGRLTEELQAVGCEVGPEAGRSFAAHVTLVRKVAEIPREMPVFPSLAWVCEGFVLVRSRLSARGSTYEIIGHRPLA